MQLYRANRFPDEWILERTLLDLQAVDPTPFEFQKRWWMFVSPLVVNGHTPLTLLFSAAQPWGPWSTYNRAAGWEVTGARAMTPKERVL